MNPQDEEEFYVTLLCFPDDTDESMAYQCAEEVRRRWKHFGQSGIKARLDLRFRLWLGDSPARWRMVADALAHKTRFQPTPSRRNIVRAYSEAQSRASHVPGGGMDVEIMMAGPTMSEVRSEFVRLFHRRQLPSRQSIKKTLILLGLQLREAKQGRPRNWQPKVAR